jgi:hypothetical protein
MYRVMSRLSSIRAPTESSTDFAEAGVTCIRPPRTRLIAVAAASSPGRPVHRVLPTARAHCLDPRDRGKQLKHLPETGQHADDEDDADRAVEVGLDRKTGCTSGQTKTAPAMTQPRMMSIRTI